MTHDVTRRKRPAGPRFRSQRAVCAGGGRTLCPQPHPARANVRRGKAEEPLTGGGYHPRTGIPGLRTVIPAPVTTMIAAPGAPLVAAEGRHPTGEVRNPRHGPATIRRHPVRTPQADGAPRYLPSQHDSNPAGRTGNPDRPAMYPRGYPASTSRGPAPPPGEPQRPRRRIRFCMPNSGRRMLVFLRTNLYLANGCDDRQFSLVVRTGGVPSDAPMPCQGDSSNIFGLIFGPGPEW